MQHIICVHESHAFQELLGKRPHVVVAELDVRTVEKPCEVKGHKFENHKDIPVRSQTVSATIIAIAIACSRGAIATAVTTTLCGTVPALLIIAF